MMTGIGNSDNRTTFESQEDVPFTGVPSEYQDMFRVLVFLLVLFVAGDVFCLRGLRIVPALVGYIAAGVALGPEGADFVVEPSMWVLLGNLGLVLLLTQAGLEMDLEILQQVGLRGCVMAVTGSILPIALGMFVTRVVLGYEDTNTVIAAGCCFGPTSAGIAMNVLGSVLEQPVGQLIVAAAIVDDILALLVLSQLQALMGDNNSETNVLQDVLVPIISAFGWLLVGGAFALFVAPKILDAMHSCLVGQVLSLSVLIDRFRLEQGSSMDPSEDRVTFSFIVLVGLLVALLSATFHSEASYLLGAFLTGLAFCQEPGLADRYRQHVQTVLDWLMRVFFAATIGFQVPIRSWNATSIGHGFIFSMALLGKFAVGPLLTPSRWGSSDGSSSMSSTWWRNAAIVGCSMAGEAEFAMVVAVYGVTEGLLPPKLYASIVLAILLSTIVSPVGLRIVLLGYQANNKQDDDKSDDLRLNLEMEERRKPEDNS